MDIHNSCPPPPTTPQPRKSVCTALLAMVMRSGGRYLQFSPPTSMRKYGVDHTILDSLSFVCLSALWCLRRAVCRKLEPAKEQKINALHCTSVRSFPQRQSKVGASLYAPLAETDVVVQPGHISLYPTRCRRRRGWLRL